MPILEDYEFVRRFERPCKTAYVRDVEVLASARRFEANPFRTILLLGLIQTLFILGVPAGRLAHLYGDRR